MHTNNNAFIRFYNSQFVEGFKWDGIMFILIFLKISNANHQFYYYFFFLQNIKNEVNKRICIVFFLLHLRSVHFFFYVFIIFCINQIKYSMSVQRFNRIKFENCRHKVIYFNNVLLCIKIKNYNSFVSREEKKGKQTTKEIELGWPRVFLGC